jgi:hypothetical protein
MKFEEWLESKMNRNIEYIQRLLKNNFKITKKEK